MYWNVAAVMHYFLHVLLNIGLYFLDVCNLGCIRMYILCVSIQLLLPNQINHYYYYSSLTFELFKCLYRPEVI